MVADRRYAEKYADFKATQTAPTLSFAVRILKDTAKVYTPKVIKWLQSEIVKGHDCDLKLFADIGTMSIYEVKAPGKRFHHTVTFDSKSNDVSCRCKKFEFAGILCGHALRVLSQKNIRKLPSQYILERWRKDVKAKTAKFSFPTATDDDPKAKMVRQYMELCQLFRQLATRASDSDEAYEIAITGLEKTFKDIASLKIKNPDEPSQVYPPAINCTTEVLISDFHNHKVRGIKVKEKIVRENSARPKNALERAIGSKRQKKVVDNTSSAPPENQQNRLVFIIIHSILYVLLSKFIDIASI